MYTKTVSTNSYNTMLSSRFLMYYFRLKGMCYIDFPDQFPLETFRSNFAYYACVRLYMYACVPSEIGALQQNVNEHDFYCVAISPAMAWCLPKEYIFGTQFPFRVQ